MLSVSVDSAFLTVYRRSGQNLFDTKEKLVEWRIVI
jgi:hypothetical protein